MINFTRVDELIAQGYITKRKHPDAPLWIYNYTAKTQYARMWTPETIVTRGLIVHEDGTIVALPFPKFFNANETPETQLDALEGRSFEATVKMDGSLGIIYYGPGGWSVATRGSFTGEQAVWATAFLRKHHAARFDQQQLPRTGATYLVEIVYPENRVVLDYGRDEKLVLIGARWFDPKSGGLIHDFLYETLRIHSEHFGLPVVEPAANVLSDLLRDQETARGVEGWVLRFDDGLRVKVKTQQYLELHRAVFGLTPERIREAVADGLFDDLYQALPEELQPGARETAFRIQCAAEQEEARLRQLYTLVRETVGFTASRGDFARYVMTNHAADKSNLFSLLDSRSITAAVIKGLDLDVVLAL